MKVYISLVLISLTSAMILTSCGGESVNVESISGFSHVSSARIAFDPMEDPAASLYINDKGCAVFVKPNEKHLGHVNPEKEYCPDMFVLDSKGILDRRQPGIFRKWGESRRGDYYIGIGGKYSVDFIEKATLKTTEIMDNRLNTILTEYNADCLGIKAVLFVVPRTSLLGIYDIQTGNEVIINLEDDYVSIHGIDLDDRNILVWAVKSMDAPPDMYIIGLEGDIKLKHSLDGSQVTQYSTACFTQDGIIVYTARRTISSSLDKYSYNGTLEWSNTVPLTGIPVLNRVFYENDELISLTVHSSEDERYIGCFNSGNGDQLYAKSFHDERWVISLDTSAEHYLYPPWSFYPEIAPPNGSISYYHNDNEVAIVNITDGIYYFTASPNGDYFAIVTDDLLSIFSYAGERSRQ